MTCSEITVFVLKLLRVVKNYRLVLNNTTYSLTPLLFLFGDYYFQTKIILFENNNRQIGIFCLKFEKSRGDYYSYLAIIIFKQK